MTVQTSRSQTGTVFNANGHAISWTDGNGGDGPATVQIDSGGTLNMGGGALSDESLVMNGNLNP